MENVSVILISSFKLFYLFYFGLSWIWTINGHSQIAILNLDAKCLFLLFNMIMFYYLVLKKIKKWPSVTQGF